ncbi:L7Ae/L30e/S12e/Gadd45 family ribosomal protein [Alicyclobacillus acidocaldarius]|uniref:L7Ae/L30e/S12e/Gadd45 family ribosomal protein n=1 Tax=Alicyclobacillus acidocaldarius TaxID=405212 RepID=UPI001ED928EE|nr:ribosomal L7Ae/L30e/S12e/Gadd45 family protein [Alicyclobacillus acidocaldarius]
MRTDKESILGLLGLARRARAVIDGQKRVLDAVRTRRAQLVMIAVDAGDNGRKKLMDKAASYGIQVVCFGTKAEIGRAIGRDTSGAVAVVEPGFAREVLARLGEFHGGGAFDEVESVRVRKADEHVEQGDLDHPQSARRARRESHERDGR